MANWYVSSVKHAAITQWAASTAISLGAYRRQLAAVANASGRVFKCTTAGTTGGTEPTWNLGNNATTNDGSVVWTQVGGQEAEQAAGNWKAALPTLASAAALDAANDIIYVAHDHAESTAAALTYPANSEYVCVNSAGSLPPVEADLATTGTIETTGNFGITFASGQVFRGLSFKVGTGSSSSSASYTCNGDMFAENCTFEIATTSATADMRLGSSSTSSGAVEWVNCKYVVANSAQLLKVGFTEFLWRDSPTPFGATLPTHILGSFASNGVRPLAILRNCDFSSITGGLYSTTSFQDISFENCKLNSAVTFSANSQVSFRSPLRVQNCDDGTTNPGYNLSEESLYSKTTIDPTVYAAGGATDGITPYSFAALPKSTNNIEKNRSTLPRISKRVNTTGSPLLFEVEMLLFASSTLPNRHALYCEFNITDDANSPVGTLHSSRSGFMDTTAIETSTVDWSGGQPLRADNTARSSGYMFSVASNPGRVFRVTSTGTSAASEPANYATAVDGDVFTDGSTTVKALYRLKCSVTATPRRRAVMFARPFMSLNTVDRLWIDPKIRIS